MLSSSESWWGFLIGVVIGELARHLLSPRRSANALKQDSAPPQVHRSIELTYPPTPSPPPTPAVNEHTSQPYLTKDSLPATRDLPKSFQSELNHNPDSADANAHVSISQTIPTLKQLYSAWSDKVRLALGVNLAGGQLQGGLTAAAKQLHDAAMPHEDATGAQGQRAVAKEDRHERHMRYMSGHPPATCAELQGFTKYLHSELLQYSMDIIPFVDYAACRFLGTTPDSLRNGYTYDVVRTIAGLFFRADMDALREAVNVFRLDHLVLRAAMDTEVARSQSWEEFRTEMKYGGGSFCQVALQKKIGQYMQDELEAALCDYLSYNWDRPDDLMAANQEYLKAEGLAGVWGQHKQQQQLPGGWSPTAQGSPVSGGAERGWTFKRRSSSVMDFGSVTASSQSEGTGAVEPGARARKNWRRARKAVRKHLTLQMLGTQRTIRTLQQMFKELARPQAPRHGDSRHPVLLLLGGGMAAGKSTVREIIGRSDFWSGVGSSAVVVEADAIKQQDVVYRSLQSFEEFQNDQDLAAYVHDFSTKAAESMLVAAVNQQKDVIFDGTMTWGPFVEQTIAMVRDHEHLYRRGPGWVQQADGSETEVYWEVDHEATEAARASGVERLPYRLELVGVTCNPSLAVARGVWRTIRTGRSVPIRSQLRSHRLFCTNFRNYCDLVDSATLYYTGTNLSIFNKGHQSMAPQVIAHKSAATRGGLLVHPEAYHDFCSFQSLSDVASSRDTMLPGSCSLIALPKSHKDKLFALLQTFTVAQKAEELCKLQTRPADAPEESTNQPQSDTRQATESTPNASAPAPPAEEGGTKRSPYARTLAPKRTSVALGAENQTAGDSNPPTELLREPSGGSFRSLAPNERARLLANSKVPWDLGPAGPHSTDLVNLTAKPGWKSFVEGIQSNNNSNSESDLRRISEEKTGSRWGGTHTQSLCNPRGDGVQRQQESTNYATHATSDRQLQITNGDDGQSAIAATEKQQPTQGGGSSVGFPRREVGAATATGLPEGEEGSPQPALQVRTKTVPTMSTIYQAAGKTTTEEPKKMQRRASHWDDVRAWVRQPRPESQLEGANISAACRKVVEGALKDALLKVQPTRRSKSGPVGSVTAGACTWQHFECLQPGYVLRQTSLQQELSDIAEQQ